MTPEEKARATIARLAGDVEPSNFTYLSGGYSNVNFRYDVDRESYVVRVVEIAAPEKHRDIERRYLAAGLGPEVIAFDFESGAMISKWIDGVLIADDAPTPEQGGAYLRELHEKIPRGVHAYEFDSIVRQYLAGSSQPPRVQRALDENWRPRTSCGCHNDLNPWNVIRGKTRWYTLDWEFAGDNDPLFDAVGLAFGLDWSPAQMRRCLATYGLEVADERILATERAFYLREYAWAVAQLDRGNVRAEIEAQRDDMLARL